MARLNKGISSMSNGNNRGSADPRVTLRPVTAEDGPFLLDVYEAAREIEMAMVPWDQSQKQAFLKQQFEAQSSYYADKFPTATHDIIEFNNDPAGRLYVERSERHISILDVTVLTRFRRRGIGSFLITQLQKEAAVGGKSLGVYVETFNPSQKLFGDLG